MQRILLIYTGGTIGMKTNPETGSLAPFDFSQMATEVPELKNFKIEIDTITFDPAIDSSNVTPQTWIDLATIIQENYGKYNGFVILHGTDTMAYSASALSFMLENLSKPIIFTGSQIPMGVLRTDGRENLISAIEIAANCNVPEVCIYFQTYLLRANRTTKNNSEHFDAFRSENYPPLAEAGITIKYNDPYISKPDVSYPPLEINTNLDTNIVVLKLFPGLSQQVVEATLSIKGLRGVVLETYGAGNAFTDEWFNRAIANSIKQDIVIINVTQCASGSVDMTLYDTGRALLKAGVISGGDMTSEAAITKLMHVLGKNLSADECATYLKNSIRGEKSN